MEKITIKQIAEKASVSVATVSRVINQTGRFSAETEERVKKIIEEYHYVPNNVAKGLRTNTTRVVGVIVPDITNQHFAKMVLEIEKALFAKGYSTMICNTNESRELEERHVKSLEAQRVSGIIFISGCHMHQLQKQIPVLYLDRRPSQYDQCKKDVILIESDNEKGGYLAVKELLEKGCRQIAIISSPSSDLCHVTRRLGGQKAMKDFGQKEDAAIIIEAAKATIEEGKNAVKELLNRECAVDGIFCTSDTLAIGAMVAFREEGYHIPQDVRIVGYDDSDLARICDPQLTSVHQSVKKMALEAVRELLEMMKGELPEKRHTVFPVCLVERDSTR